MLPSGGHLRQPCLGSWQNAPKGCWPRQHVWQHEASTVLETHFTESSILPQLVLPRAHWHFSPSQPRLAFGSDLFRVLLLRRLRLPSSPVFTHCQCAHHRASCSRVGVLGRRSLPRLASAVSSESLHQCLLAQCAGPAPHCCDCGRSTGIPRCPVSWRSTLLSSHAQTAMLLK